MDGLMECWMNRLEESAGEKEKGVGKQKRRTEK